MLEILLTTSLFLVLGVIAGLIACFMQKPKNEAETENHTEETTANAEKQIPMQAVILCSGNIDENPPVYDYRGAESCQAALVLGEGGRTCLAGCIGLGDCMTVCPEDAIEIRKGLALVNILRCTGCGECVDVCPKKLIALRPREFTGQKHCIRGCNDGICDACGLNESK